MSPLNWKPLAILLGLAWWCFLLPARAAGQSSSDAPTSEGMVLVRTVDFEGMPIGGIQLRLLSGTSGASAATTGENGELPPLALARSPDGILVSLDDARFQSPEPMQNATAEAPALTIRVFHASAEARSLEENRAYAEVLPAILSQPRASPKPALPGGGEATTAKIPAGELTASVAAAFLGGWRRTETPITVDPPAHPEPEAGTLTEGEDAPDKAPRIALRVVNDLGQPTHEALVHLYQYEPERQAVSLVTYERTDREGRALFRNLDADRPYRAEVRDGDFKLSRSSILYAKSGADTRSEKTLVLRDSAEAVSGFVFFGEAPSDQTKVAARAVGAGPTLSTMTDAMGYFQLGPLPSGDLILEFERPGRDESIKGWSAAATGEREVLVPLDLIAE